MTPTLPTNTLAQQLLIAMPHLQDDFFSRSLVYLCGQDAAGAMGFIINKPSSLTLADLFEQLDIPCSHPDVLARYVLQGGPVQTDIALILHSSPGHWSTSQAVGPDLFVTGSKEILEAIAQGEGPEHYLVIRGYAGWASGQLEEEISQNAWLTAEASPALLFDDPYYRRWENAGKSLGFDIHLLSSEAGHA